MLSNYQIGLLIFSTMLLLPNNFVIHFSKTVISQLHFCLTYKNPVYDIYEGPPSLKRTQYWNKESIMETLKGSGETHDLHFNRNPYVAVGINDDCVKKNHLRLPFKICTVKFMFRLVGVLRWDILKKMIAMLYMVLVSTILSQW